MDLDAWRAAIRPHLEGIEVGAEMCRRHVGHLVFKPPFDTLAFEELQKLDRILVLALEKVRKAQAAYRELQTGE